MDASEVIWWTTVITRNADVDDVARALSTRVEQATDYDAQLVPPHARYREVELELAGPGDRRVVGVRVELAEPEPLPWADLDALFGEPKRIIDRLDHHGPLSPYYRVLVPQRPPQTLRFNIDDEDRVIRFLVRELTR